NRDAGVTRGVGVTRGMGVTAGAGDTGGASDAGGTDVAGDAARIWRGLIWHGLYQFAIGTRGLDTAGALRATSKLRTIHGLHLRCRVQTHCIRRAPSGDEGRQCGFLDRDGDVWPYS